MKIIKSIPSENIYFDEVEKKLITTYNKHVAILQIDENRILINDAESQIPGSLCYMEEKLYLPFSDMELVYDFEYDYCKDTNAVIIDSISKEKLTAKTLKKVDVKSKKSFFAKKIDVLEPGVEVTVLEKDEKHYKIRTSEGLIGFVKSKKNRRTIHIYNA